MILNAKNIAGLFTGFETSFNKGFEGADSHYSAISMLVQSTSSQNTYAWMGQLPKFREWLGDRILQNLMAHSYTLVNKDYENTITVGRNDIEDDKYGVFAPLFEEMGRLSREHPDELIFSLLKKGFEEKCYDGKPFFSETHDVLVDGNNAVPASNFQTGEAEPWFLLDCSRAMRPMVFQERKPYKFVALDQMDDENVFMRKHFIYGVDARVNAGFGLWQLAYASKQPLSYESFTAARSAMRSLKGDYDRPLGIKPTHLVVSPAYEEEARSIVEGDVRVHETENGVASVSNPWRGTTKLIVTEWLS